MTKTFKTVVFVSSLTSLLLSSCLHDSDLSNVTDVTYSGDVKRIINANCNFPSCHGSGAGAGGLTQYEEVMRYVQAGKAHKSTLYRVITGRSNQKMPPAGNPKLSTADIRTLYIWIEQGAKNN